MLLLNPQLLESREGFFMLHFIPVFLAASRTGKSSLYNSGKHRKELPDGLHRATQL